MRTRFLNRPRRWPLLAAGGGLALLLAVAIGLTVQTGSPRTPGRKATPAAVQPPGPVAGTTGPGSPAPAPGLSGPLHLIRGSQLINDVYLGYPHSTAGAVSAAAEYMTGLGSTLDPDRAAAVMRLTADPSYPAGPQDFAQGMVSTRNDLGLPASGPVPDGVSTALDAAEYQVRDATADQVTVLLLADYVLTLPGQGTQTRVVVYPLRMHWAAGDWKILRPDDSAGYSGLSAEPGSAQAAASGWQELER